MTNEELKEIAKLVVTSDLPLSSMPMVKSLAHGVIRLLRENKAMREMLYDVAEIAKFLNWRSDIGYTKAQEIIDSIHDGKWGNREGIWVQVSKTISQLGERSEKTP